MRGIISDRTHLAALSGTQLAQITRMLTFANPKYSEPAQNSMILDRGIDAVLLRGQLSKRVREQRMTCVPSEASRQRAQ